MTPGENGPFAAAEFAAFEALLGEAFPTAIGALEKLDVSERALLYRWPAAEFGYRHAGARPPPQKPIAFVGHIDVVPVEPGTEEDWTHPAFDGVIADGFVWGRGAHDNKGRVIALMAAADRLAASKFLPSRDIYFAFGMDEESWGGGARDVVAWMQSEGVQLAWAWDEGAPITVGFLPGATSPVALIGNAEKGYLTVKLTARGQGGHSSAPPADTAVSRLAKAIEAISESPFPAKLDGQAKEMLGAFASVTPLSQRAALSNLWVAGPLVKGQLLADPILGAALRTTIAPTIISGGSRENVLPQQAEAIINLRIHPRDTVESALAHLRKATEGLEVEIEPLPGANEASPVSPTDGEGYKAITAALKTVYGDIPAAPFLLIAATDSRYYPPVADAIYRFDAVMMTPQDLGYIHGTDERMSVDALSRAVAVFEAAMRDAAG